MQLRGGIIVSGGVFTLVPLCLMICSQGGGCRPSPGAHPSLKTLPWLVLMQISLVLMLGRGAGSLQRDVDNNHRACA